MYMDSFNVALTDLAHACCDWCLAFVNNIMRETDEMYATGRGLINA